MLGGESRVKRGEKRRAYREKNIIRKIR